MRAKALFLKSKAQHEERVRAIFKNKTLALMSANPSLYKCIFLC